MSPMMGNGINDSEGVMNQTRTLVLASCTILSGAQRREYGSDSSHPVSNTNFGKD